MSIRAVCAAIAAFGGHVFGNIDGLFYALIAYVIIDYITGVCVAIHNKNFQAE